MGAKPAFFTLGLTIPHSDPQWLAAFALGMAELAAPIGLVLVGGDTTKGPLTISLQVHGYVEPEFAISRAGAKVGDDIYVTGNLGDAAAALPIVTGEMRVKSDIYGYFYDAYWRPESRLIAAMALKRVVSAMLDVSDGLVQDLQHILTASQVGAQIEASRLPMSEELMQWQPEAALQYALTGGDDYELCFTAPVSAREEIALITQTLHLPCTQLGTITEKGLDIQGYDGQLGGFQHF